MSILITNKADGGGAIPTATVMNVKGITSSISSATQADVVFGTVNSDTASGYSVVTGEYTVPATAFYDIGTSLGISGTTALNGQNIAYIFVNGSEIFRQSVVDEVSAVGGQAQPSLSFNGYPLSTGDVVKIRAYTDRTGPGYTRGFFSVTKCGA